MLCTWIQLDNLTVCSQASGKSGTTFKRKGTCNPCHDASFDLHCLYVVIGEEQPGGLVIVRAPPTRTPPSQDAHPDPQPSRTSSVQPSQQHPPNSNASKPPSKKFKAAPETNLESSHPDSQATHQTNKGKGRDIPATQSQPEAAPTTSQTQPDVEPRSRQPPAGMSVKSSILNPAFQFPQRSTPTRERIQDSSVPIPTSETPQIEKNKMMRGEMPHRRRSSISRGKRASSSFENTGVISKCEYRFHSFLCPVVNLDADF